MQFTLAKLFVAVVTVASIVTALPVVDTPVSIVAVGITSDYRMQ